MSRMLLDVQNLKKHFPIKNGIFSRTKGYVKAVDGVSFQIHEGETFALIGESGCGKTTVGKMVMRLLEPTEGSIVFDGRDITHLKRKEMMEVRRNVQIIFQDPYGSLNPRMTVEELVREPMLHHRMIKAQDARAQVTQLLSMVGLGADDLSKYPHEFSGGQRQRIVIARALSLKPQLLICDEPVSALDVSVQAQVLNLLDDIQKELGIAYLFIAHGMPVIKHISDRVGIMYLGKLVEVADVDSVFESALHPYTKALMSAVPIPDPDAPKHHVALKGEIPSPIDIPSGCRFHSRCPQCMARCAQEEPTMRQIRPGHFIACHLYDEKGGI